jgi:tetratricopeptide (TPR) repeat protein
MGKTSLGAAVADAWGRSDVFWYTIRPTLNDDLRSLLFSLAHFLHQRGSSILWQKLIADEGKIEDFNLALGILRDDLAALAQRPLLFCFDEVDRLRPPDEDNLTTKWRQLLEFLDGLRGECALLLIGQRAVLDGDEHFLLDGLMIPQVRYWLQRLEIPHTAAEVDKLHQYTGGNPRLIQLCIALRQDEEALSDVLAHLGRSSVMQPLFERLWLRTSAEERLWLQSLAVFRSPMPADSLSVARRGRQSLIARQLIQEDGRGGLSMWPALRELIYRELSAEEREQLHLQAAMIRAARGEYTAAAYHYRQAGRLKEAVQLWYPHRQQEIERGQGSAALAIFQEISSNQLPKKERAALAIIRAGLKLLVGDVHSGQRELAQIEWPLAHEVTVQGRLLQGIFQSSLGYPDAAVQSYEEGMAVIARLLNSLIRFRHKSGRVHVRQRNLEAAWREARLALVEVQNLQGMIQAEQGEYAAAQAAHSRALEVAESINDERGIAQAHHQLAALMAYQGKLDEMIAHTEEAMTYYERTGDLVLAHMARINLSAAYIQGKRFAEAAETAHQALPFFERIKEPYGMSTTAANLAEAYYELGELELAEKYAYYVMQQEEPHTMPYALFTLGMVRRKQKRLKDAAAVLQSGAELAHKNGDRYLLAYTRRALGEVHCEQGDAEAAHCLWREAHTLFEALGLDSEVAQTAALLA